VADRVGAQYFETSALTGQGMSDLFDAIAGGPNLILDADLIKTQMGCNCTRGCR
jgi:hypothetical protein